MSKDGERRQLWPEMLRSSTTCERLQITPYRPERAAVHDYATVWRSAAAPVEPIQPDPAAVPGLYRDQSAGAAAISAVHRYYGPVPERRQLGLQRAPGAGHPALQRRARHPRRV